MHKWTNELIKKEGWEDYFTKGIPVKLINTKDLSDNYLQVLLPKKKTKKYILLLYEIKFQIIYRWKKLIMRLFMKEDKITYFPFVKMFWWYEGYPFNYIKNKKEK